MAKQKTIYEIKIDLMKQLNRIAKIWIKMSDKNIKEKVNGAISSTLLLLDGESILPKFIIAPDPEKGDKEYNVKEKCNYYPVNYDKRVRGNISGNLHEMWSEFQYKEKNKVKNKIKKKRLSLLTIWLFIWIISYIIGVCFILNGNITYSIFMLIAFYIISKFLE